MIDDNIRHASKEDVTIIAEIYNQSILTGLATFDSFNVSHDRYLKFLTKDDRWILIVYIVDQKVVAWGSVWPVSDRWAYRPTGQISTFVESKYRNLGIGKKLKLELFSLASNAGYHSLISEVLSTNPLSVSINTKLGFRMVGEIHEAGFRDKSWINLIIMQKILSEKSMKERQFRFTVLTKNISRSIKFYQEILGLNMRPICNAIAMFPLGYAEFEVCQASETQELLGLDLENQLSSGVLITLKKDANDIDLIFQNALNDGAVAIDSSVKGAKSFRDFNGVTWLVEAN